MKACCFLYLQLFSDVVFAVQQMQFIDFSGKEFLWYETKVDGEKSLVLSNFLL